MVLKHIYACESNLYCFIIPIKSLQMSLETVIPSLALLSTFSLPLSFFIEIYYYFVDATLISLITFLNFIFMNSFV